MLSILIYAFSIMYSPGPVNLLGMHSGINRNTRGHIGFFAGVAFAMLLLFISLGLLGATLVNPVLLPYLSLLGCCYILYVAWKIMKTSVDIKPSSNDKKTLSFWDGFLIQLLNPKGLVATLPIATIQFPAEDIYGMSMILWSVGLSMLAFGAPTSYSIIGMQLGKKLNNPVYFKIFNRSMSGLLVLVAFSIAHEYAYLEIIK
ncbi:MULTISPECIES: LysE family translocator [unclassified Agarivorans]|uniref:LysE family translocator n=3 Tax=unclassified Agarivorans TaxID=2636026 RepID=UPI003D7E7767